MYYKGINLRKTDTYIMDKSMMSHIKDIGFYYKRGMSSEGDTVYEYVFPVYFYHNDISLECRLLLHYESRNVSIDVFDTGSHGIYGPWYFDNSGIHRLIIKKVNKNIRRELTKLRIQCIKEEDNNGENTEMVIQENDREL